jgi:Sugar-specific transcriptional regulator TrmB
MHGVIERRRHYLRLMRNYTLDQGSFTVTDIQAGAQVPRSTAQDWINRLVDEGCVVQKVGKSGRQPARYAAISAMPSSACRRIFTTIDGDEVEIFHECMSGACAAFCGHHHTLAQGAVVQVEREGTLLRECARIGRKEIKIGLYPSAAVGVLGVDIKGDCVIQHIRCIGGPAYSLTDMIAHAEGVSDVKVHRDGDIVEGEIWTRALVHLMIGIDDTDSRSGGATFALALALLQHLGKMEGVFPIGHHVAMLYQGVAQKTAGNSCSNIDLAVEPDILERVVSRILLFIEDETFSPEWGIAVKRGFRVTPGLRHYGIMARETLVSLETAQMVAEEHDIRLYGGRGVIGALAAVALSGLSHDMLLNPEKTIPCEQDPFQDTSE